MSPFGKLHVQWRNPALIVVALLGAFLARFGASLLAPSISSLNEQCVLCHIDVVEKSMTLPDQHKPFFERNCTVCHLAPELASASSLRASTDGMRKGSEVPQVTLWRKRRVEKSPVRQHEHTVAIKGLDPVGRYRFHVVAKSVDGTVATEWFSLIMSDVPNSVMELPVHTGDTSSGNPFISARLLQASPTAVFVNWTTRGETEGRVELEELEGIDIQDGRVVTKRLDSAQVSESATSPHPPLNRPINLAIDICYNCHPQSELGTSHPVRVYARSRKTDVPDDLPTVEGMVTCATCHHPHAGPGEKLIREKIKTKVCVACHTGFRRTSRSTMF